MTDVSIKHEVIKAQKGGYAVPLFDIFDSFGVEGVMDALTANRAPTIIAIYSPFIHQINSKALAAYILSRAADTDVPVTLMLDHGVSVDACLQALDNGFTDVMYDGSALPLEENIANTRKVVKAGHARGASVEAELGYIGRASDYDEATYQNRSGFTDPDTVEFFVKETGVDFLAIAFGNAHGLYKGKPKLDLDLVSKIHSRTSIPLVMHGGTGLSDEQFKGAIEAGISKINFATSIINTSIANMKKAAAIDDATISSIPEGIRTAYREWCTQLYQVFGTAGRV
jgi:fructose-bisphosphate aldolase, class II